MAFAAIMARSDHPGGVNTPMGDASVRFVDSTVAEQTWRSPGSVASHEVSTAEAC